MNKKIITICFVLIATLSFRVWLSAAPRTPERQPLAGFPAELGPFSMRSSEPIDPEVQAVLKADDYLVRDYRTADGKLANVFIAYYRVQKAGESMHSPKNCLPGSGWEPVLNDRVTISAPRGPLEVNRYLVEKGANKSLILYWYHSGNRVYASEYWGKAYLVLDTARTGRRDGAIARVVIPVRRDGDVDAATKEAAVLAASMEAHIGPYIGAD